MKPIPIGAAKRIADNHDYDQVVIVARKVGPPGIGGDHVTTYGRDKDHGQAAARIGDLIKREILRWESETRHRDPGSLAEKYALEIEACANRPHNGGRDPPRRR